MTEPAALLALREMNRTRRKHRKRAARVLLEYLGARNLLVDHASKTNSEAPPDRLVALFSLAQLRLMRAQEASRGSRVRARRAHEAWDAACARTQRVALVDRKTAAALLDDAAVYGAYCVEVDPGGKGSRVPPSEWPEEYRVPRVVE